MFCHWVKIRRIDLLLYFIQILCQISKSLFFIYITIFLSNYHFSIENLPFLTLIYQF
jgi:hypothetical protein